MLARILQGLLDFVSFVVNSLVGALPNSPFTWDFSWLGQWWTVVNFFIPFQAMASLTLYYVGAVGVWYGVRWLLRIVRYIQ